MSQKEATQDGRKKLKKFEVTVTGKFGFDDSPYSLLRKSRREKRDEITRLYEHYATLRTLAICAYFYNFQVSISKDTLSSKKKSVKRFLSFSDLLKYNEVITPTMGLCASEFYLFITELQTGGYDGAARTLRCMLETAVEACEFQTQENRPTYDLLAKEYELAINSKKNKIQLSSLLVKYNCWAQFIERYNIFEKMNRIAPTYRELINNLNSIELFATAPQILNELKETYETLSDYVHPSSGKFLKAVNRKSSPLLQFNPEDFDSIYQVGLKVLDCVEFIYITTITKFLKSKENQKFLEYISTSTELPTEIASSFLSLPYSKRLACGITFKFSPVKKR